MGANAFTSTGTLSAGAITATSFSGAGTGLTGTAASLTAGAATSVAWTNVSSKPTTVSGYGITDFISSKSGSPLAAADNAVSNGLYYVTGVSLFGQTDGALFNQAY